jgi:hypothetical protein
MDVDVLYSYLMNSSRIFLMGWLLLIVLAGLIEFRHDRL